MLRLSTSLLPAWCWRWTELDGVSVVVLLSDCWYACVSVNTTASASVVCACKQTVARLLLWACHGVHARMCKAESIARGNHEA